jgi:hypothetical protein
MSSKKMYGYLRWLVVITDRDGDDMVLAAFTSYVAASDFANVQTKYRHDARVVELAGVIHVDNPALAGEPESGSGPLTLSKAESDRMWDNYPG